MAVTALVVSGKGGTGKSTVAALLGEALAFSGKKVLAVELDCGLRALDSALGLAKDIVFDFGDLIRGSAAPTDAVYPCSFCRGLSLIAASAHPAEIPGGLLSDLENEVGRDFDFILLDCPAGIGSALKRAAAEADRAIITAVPDPVSVRAARLAANTVRRAGCTEQRLIINRVPTKPGLLAPLKSLDEVIDGTGVQLMGLVWDDRETHEATAFGRSLAPSSKNCVPFSNIAKRFCGEHVPLSIK